MGAAPRTSRSRTSVAGEQHKCTLGWVWRVLVRPVHRVQESCVCRLLPRRCDDKLCLRLQLQSRDQLVQASLVPPCRMLVARKSPR
jgi:hypothetical protein